MNTERVIEFIEQEAIRERFIQWNGDNLVDVIRFTGIHDDFLKWFKGWIEYTEYVKEHNNIFKIFTENGHYEIPVGSWIVRAPDEKAYPFGEGVKFIDKNIKPLNLDDIDDEDLYSLDYPSRKPKKNVTFYYDDPFDMEVVCDDNSTSLRRKGKIRRVESSNLDGLSKYAISKEKPKDLEVEIPVTKEFGELARNLRNKMARELLTDRFTKGLNRLEKFTK